MVELLHWRLNFRADTHVGTCPHTVILPATVTGFLLYITKGRCLLRNWDIVIRATERPGAVSRYLQIQLVWTPHGCLIFITLQFIVVSLSDVVTNV